MGEPAKLIFAKFGMNSSQHNGIKPVRVSLSEAQQRLMNTKLSLLKQDLGINLHFFRSEDIETLLGRVSNYAHKLFVDMAKKPGNKLFLLKIVLNKGNVLSLGLSEGAEADGATFGLSDPRGIVLSAVQKNHVIFVPDVGRKALQILTFGDERHCLNESDLEKYGLNIFGLIGIKGLKSLLAAPFIYHNYETGALRELGAIIIGSGQIGHEFIDSPGDLVVIREFANFTSRALNNFI